MYPKIQDLASIISLYCGPDRHYHTMDHINDMLKGAAAANASALQMWAILFHDVIYNATRTDNEERSADMAVEYLSGVLSAEDLETVKQIILSTKLHEPLVPEAALVSDLDLCPLAIPPEDFERNRWLIREEFKHLTKEAYMQGTHHFAEGLLAKEHIYLLPEFRDLHEANARRNLATLLLPELG